MTILETGHSTRRHLIVGCLSAVTLYAANRHFTSYIPAQHTLLPETKSNLTRPEKLGTTFSISQCDYLGFDSAQTHQAFERLCMMNFDYIRIPTYWNRIERANGFNFSEVDWQLEMADKYSQNIILTVGVKSPRWPEFYFGGKIWRDFPHAAEHANPVDSHKDLAAAILDYVPRVVEHIKNQPLIKYIQVENEAINDVLVGKLRRLSTGFVQKEMNLVKKSKRADQKILLTNSVSGPSADERFYETLDLGSDAIGIAVYYRTPLPFGFYFEDANTFWKDRIVKWSKDLKERDVEAFVTESQAEPWEWEKPALFDQREYSSANPKDSIDLAVRLGKAGYKVVLLWGSEYWIGHNLKFGGEEWLKPIQELIESDGI